MQADRSPRALSYLVLVLLSSSWWITSSLADDWPAPTCRPVAADHPQLLDSSGLPGNLDLVERRNAEYFFSQIAPERDVSKGSHAYVLNEGPVSIFFPDLECSMECPAFLVRTNERGNLVKTISFVSHMVHVAYPEPSQVFLAGDGIHFIEIRYVHKGGRHTVDRENDDVEVREWWKPPSGYYQFSSRYTMCLLRGTFGIGETSPSEPPR